MWVTGDYSALQTTYGATGTFYMTYGGRLFKIVFGALDAGGLFRNVTASYSTNGGTSFGTGIVAGSLPNAVTTAGYPFVSVVELVGFALTSGWANQATFAPTLPLGTNAVPVAAACGQNHTSLLLSNGSVRGFGRNSVYNQLGVTGSDRFQPTRAATTIDPQTVVAISAADNSTFYELLNDARDVKAFGEFFAINYAGLLAPAFTASLILKLDGTIIGAGDAFYGQLGNNYGAGTTSGNGFNMGPNGLGSLATVGVKITRIICGLFNNPCHYIALDSTGQVHAWGYNGYGQLGIAAANTTDKYIPQLVNTVSGTSSLYGKIVVAIACGQLHTLALDSTGQVHAWGYNNNGQLGMAAADTTQKFVPQLVNTASGTSSLYGKTVVAIACGATHTLVLDSTGQVHVWGNNNQGQLGMAAADVTIRYVPQLVNTVSGVSSLYGKTVVAIACGATHTLALDSTGQVHAWGYNLNGNLGMAAADTNNRYVPQLVNTVNGVSSLYGKTVVAIACGYHHSLALDSTGQVHAWGNNPYGQLGMAAADTTNRYVPQLVNMVTSSLSGRTVVAISCGAMHTLALDSTGNVHTWGYNNTGQLIINPGDVTNRYVPTLSYYFLWNGQLSVGGTTPLMLNFTGQHRCFVAIDGKEGLTSRNVLEYDGLVVVSDRGTYVDPQLNNRTLGPSGKNDALPVVSLCSKARDSRAFGVISATVDLGVKLDDSGKIVEISNPDEMAHIEEIGDVRSEINAIGDGSLWVLESAAPIQNKVSIANDPNSPAIIPDYTSTASRLYAGDLVTTSTTLGYAQAQGDDCMRSCTVAKLTMDCDFNPALSVPLVADTVNGQRVIDPVTGGPVWIESTLGAQPVYQLRYVVVADGSVTTKEDWETSIAAGDDRVRRAALLGCTYHSG
jgi:alpha-tubulin suppressor-like RCC1 family protein